jgi:iron complex outermembrane receptor protein
MKLSSFSILAGSSLLAFASNAHAEAPPSSATEAPSLQEVVVTARRRSEAVEDVPQVVDVVTSDTLAKYNIQQLQDVQALVPGLTLFADNSGTNASAALRGVSFNVQTGITPTVNFYLNEVPQSTYVVMQSIYDLGQMEVLRGPQGTLRGRSSPSGAITITTHAADTSELGGYAEVLDTDRNAVKADGAFNLPLIKDILAIRVAGEIDDNRLDHVMSLNNPARPHDLTTGERVSLTFTPTDDFKFTAMYQHLANEKRFYLGVAGSGAPGGPLGTCNIQGLTGLIPIPCPPAGYNGPVLTPQDRTAVSNRPESYSHSDYVLTTQAEYRFAGQMLTYVGGYYNQHFTSAQNTPDSANMIPGGPVPLDVDYVQNPEWSQELRLSSEERVAGRFDYTVGLFYDHFGDDITLPWPASYLPGAFGSPLGLPSPYTLDNRYLIYSDTIERAINVEKSAFASITWHIDPKTDLTGGGRYIIATDDDSIDTNLRSDGIIALPAYLPQAFGGLGLPPGTPCSFVPGAVGQTYPNTCDLPSAAAVPSGHVLSNKFSGRWTPKVWNASLSHSFMDGLLAYVTYGTAWRRGGAVIGIRSGDDPLLTSLTHLQPENSKGWELGLKTRFLDNRAQVNIAAYRQTFDAFTYLTPFVGYLADNGNGALTPQLYQFAVNVPAIVKGVDFDSALQVMKGWSVGLGFSYADGHMLNASIPCNGPIPTGQRVALCNSNASISTAPTWNADLRSEYSTPITSAIDGYVRGLLAYYPKNDRANGEGSGFTADAYGTLNLYIGARHSDGGWDVQLFARNLTNTQKTLTYSPNMEVSFLPPTNLNFGQSGYYRTTVTPLREFGITGRYAFGSR